MEKEIENQKEKNKPTSVPVTPPEVNTDGNEQEQSTPTSEVEISLTVDTLGDDSRPIEEPEYREWDNLDDIELPTEKQ